MKIENEHKKTLHSKIKTGGEEELDIWMVTDYEKQSVSLHVDKRYRNELVSEQEIREFFAAIRQLENLYSEELSILGK